MVDKLIAVIDEKQKVPRVQYGYGTKYGGRVIQVKFCELDYFMIDGHSLDGITRAFHGDHLRNLLIQLGITDLHTFEDAYKMNFPVTCGDRYELIDAGDCFIYTPNDDKHNFSGKSGSYGLEIEKNSLVSLIPYFPKGIKVIFEDFKTQVKEVLGIGEGRE